MDKTTVMIVEDEAIVAADLAGKLERLGYELAGIVASGEEAVETACSKRPHIVLMDVWLKGAMDGIEAAEAIRRQVDVPVIYLTAHSDSATLDRAKLSGPFGYILKPFEERELATNIEMALYKHQSDRQLREQQEALRRSHDELERRVEERTRELRNANDSVRGERQRLYDVLETLPVYVILLDSYYRVPFANRFFRERFGESHGRRCYEYLFNRSEPCETCETYTVMKTKAPHHWYWTGPDGRDYDIYDYPFVDSDGSTMILEMGIDITEQKKAQSALRELNETLEERVIERTTQLNTVNEKLRQSRMAALNLMEDAIVARGQTEQVNEELRREIAERKKAEESLRKSNQRLDLLYETAGRLLASDSPQLVVNELCGKVMEFLDCHVFFNFLVDEEEVRLRLNACAGIAEDEAQRIEFLDYGTAVCGGAARDACRIVAEEIPNTPDPRTELVKSYGIKAYACHPLMAQGRVLGTLSFGTRSRSRFKDDELSLMKAVADQVAIAMERKRVEEELRKAKEAAEAASRTKSQFLANMSHELRTPMTGVLGMLEIARGGQLDERQREAIDTAHMSGKSLIMIINDILDLTRIEAGKFHMEEKPFILRKSVTDSVNFLKPEALRKGLDLDWTMADDVPEAVIGDRMRLQQILTNLLGNAVKFTKKGRIGITVTAGKKNPDGRREFTFAVSDTGIGIADDKKVLIFEPFSQADLSHTRRYGGAGLGLSISRQIAEHMGGTITLESTEGKGSTFTLTVPLLEADAGSKGTEVEAGPPESISHVTGNGAKARLLIAEDDEVTRKVLDFMFRQYNFDPRFAVNGHEVLEMWEKGCFDLIVMDGQMPEMDGFTATRAIRERELETGGRIPIIAITAHAFPEDEKRCLDAGMDAYIAKPIDFKKCVAMIRDMLGGGDAKG